MNGHKNVDYSKGIRTLLRHDQSDFKLDSKSRDLLSTVMNEVNKDLMTQFEEECASATDSRKPMQYFAHKAVEKIFKGSLKKHAVSEAQRQLALYETGSMNYNSEMEIQKLKSDMKAVKSNETKAKKSRNVSPQALLKAGIAKVFSNSHTGLTIDNSAKDYLAAHLFNFTQMVGTRAAEVNGAEEELQALDLRRTVEEYFGPAVLRIANSEGQRSLVLYENGLLTFLPKEPSCIKKSDDKESGKIFKTGIKGFLSEFSHDATIDAKASKTIEDILKDVVHCLALESIEFCEEAGTNEMTDVAVKDVVQKTFPELLKQHALIQGSTDVDSYNSGLLKYAWRPSVARKAPSPVKATTAAKKKTAASTRKRKVDDSAAKTKKLKKSTKPPEPSTSTEVAENETKVANRKNKKIKLDFTNALLDLCPSVFPSLKVVFNRDSSNKIGTILDDVCQRLATEACEITRNNAELDVEAVKIAVNTLFPGELAQHAVAFGSSIVTLNSYE